MSLLHGLIQRKLEEGVGYKGVGQLPKLVAIITAILLCEEGIARIGQWPITWQLNRVRHWFWDKTYQ